MPPPPHRHAPRQRLRHHPQGLSAPSAPPPLSFANAVARVAAGRTLAAADARVAAGGWVDWIVAARDRVGGASPWAAAAICGGDLGLHLDLLGLVSRM